MSLIEQIREAVIDGQAKVAIAKTEEAIKEGLNPEEVLQNGLIDAMREVGELFEEGEFFVPEMLIAARAMKGALDLLKPHLVDSGVEPLGKIAIGTVKGDLHDIGKSLVAMMVEGAGFEVLDLGVDVTAEEFVEAVKNQGAQVIAMSALLTTTMPNMESTISSLNDAGVRDQIQVMVGGAPVTSAYADQIGADGYAADASSAVRKAKELLGK